MIIQDLIRFPEQNNGLPIVSRQEMDVAAEDIVRALQPELFQGSIDATDLKLLFNELKSQGWGYMGRYLSRSGSLLGAAVWKEGTMTVYDENRLRPSHMVVPEKTILMDKGLYEKKNQSIYRFTLAHEMGHALLHGDYSSSSKNMDQYRAGMKERFEDSEDRFLLRDDKKLRNPYDWMEWQANTFASAVLMPKSLVMEVADLLEDESGWASADYLNELMVTIHDVFKVSESAAYYRMQSLGLLVEGAKRLSNGAIIIEPTY